MRKLLSANFARLRKDPIFCLTIACLTIVSLIVVWTTYRTNQQIRDTVFNTVFYTETAIFYFIPMMPFVCAGFISLFLGTEFDDNTIRNKLIVGHTRTEVFFANYLTCMAASTLQLMTTLLVSGIAGWVLSKAFLMAWTELAFIILCCVLVAAVFSAISVGIAMNIHKKAFAIAASFLFMFGILFAASYMEGVLLEAEMVYDGVTITMEGVQFGDLVENPAYIGGNARTIVEFLYDMLPTGQAIQMNNMNFERCLRWPVLSVIMLFISTVAGYIPFRKRDIR